MKTMIQTMKPIKPTLYAWRTKDIPKYQGWFKIGYTTRTAQERVKEQASQVLIHKDVIWSYEARYLDANLSEDEKYFDDHDFHNYLTRIRKVEREKNSEWFNYHDDVAQSKKDFKDFAFGDWIQNKESKNQSDYVLRKEQAEAVQQALHYFKQGGKEFLWNAKPRFGKTLASYDLIRKLDAVNVLIVTNRPAIANSWYEDYEKFIQWQTNYLFCSETDALKNRPVLNRKEYEELAIKDETDSTRQIGFVSLQDLKGSMYLGTGGYDKLKWVAHTNWDIVIIDEAHEAIDTFKTDVAFNLLKTKHFLHLSGTPFKALANDKFSEEQIYTWSYEDEQLAKQTWNSDEYNPYENLPTLNMFTYQLSNMMIDKANEGVEVNGEEHAYYFDLNEFFSTNDSRRFVYENEVRTFLDCLTTNEKYPFSTPELRNELKHTFWLLNRVDSAKAMAKLLAEHPVFKDYQVVLAAGNGKKELDNQGESMDYERNAKSLDLVRQAVNEYDKTITLSVGQLTTGVTIPEWSAVLMLSNIQSPALYMQAAFRAQNPYQYVENNELKRKENAYVFDFAPERTLILFDEFANDLKTATASGKGTSTNREENIQTLLNFLPVIGEDVDGKMVELDAEKVLTIPRKIKATEVVRHGFMSNFLFANIANIFRAPQIIQDTINQLMPAKEEKKKTKQVDTSQLQLNPEGEIEIADELVINTTNGLFTDEKITEAVTTLEANAQDIVEKNDDKTIEKIAKQVTSQILPPKKELEQHFENVTKSDMNQMQQSMKNKIAEKLNEEQIELNKKKASIQLEFAQKQEKAKDELEKQQLENEQTKQLENLFKVQTENIVSFINESMEELQAEVVKEQYERQEKRKMKMVENDVRDHLRGFSRTIPSFVMAYGDDKLTLANFDDYTPDDVFYEVTGISEAQFRMLRDGGEYIDSETGEVKYFAGHLFDEVVFNESIQEFLRLKQQLGNYFDDSQEIDIFDYIPLQKTNQKFTPKKYVQLMVENLEKENPGIFDDANQTFFDPYVKSGLFLTEIAKKLYHSNGLKGAFPDEKDRIKHIMEHQIYGAAPTTIIYQIAKNFVYGPFPEVSSNNLKLLNLEQSAKDGTMQEVIQQVFGGENVGK
ncbi:DEAD/DEAH box helicase family protein [Enterococcus cecorum]|nr:DEAD/DEAH box helicase family protein [Enterococcus cecorum]